MHDLRVHRVAQGFVAHVLPHHADPSVEEFSEGVDVKEVVVFGLQSPAVHAPAGVAGQVLNEPRLDGVERALDVRLVRGGADG